MWYPLQSCWMYVEAQKIWWWVTLIAKFTGQHGAHLGPAGPRWAPCWLHEPYYLVSFCFVRLCLRWLLLAVLSGVKWFIYPYSSRLLHWQKSSKSYQMMVGPNKTPGHQHLHYWCVLNLSIAVQIKCSALHCCLPSFLKYAPIVRWYCYYCFHCGLLMSYDVGNLG